VALLSAVETVNPKIKSTLDAAALCKMADRGQITGGILDGPLAFDTAVSARPPNQGAGLARHRTGRHSGRSHLESGNMLAKQLEYLGGRPTGRHRPRRPRTHHPHSRADSAETRLTSCAVAVLLHYATHPAVKV